MSSSTKAPLSAVIAKARQASLAKAAADARPEPPPPPAPPLSGAFEARAAEVGVQLYADDLRAILLGELPDLPYFRSWRLIWRKHWQPGRAALLTGPTGAGKSIMALWSCYSAGLAWDFLDLGELSIALQMRNQHRWDRWTRVPVLVVDEWAPENLPEHAFPTLKLLANLRYRSRRTTIFCSCAGLEELRGDFGDELCDRIHPDLIAKAEDKTSHRHKHARKQGKKKSKAKANGLRKGNQ